MALHPAVLADLLDTEVRRARLKLGEAAGLDRALKICRDVDTLGRAEAGVLDYRAHTNGEP